VILGKIIARGTLLARITNTINVDNIEQLAAVCALLRETLRRAGRSCSEGASFLVRHSFSDGGMRRSKAKGYVK
jgi:hypothetical protein